MDIIKILFTSIFFCVESEHHAFHLKLCVYINAQNETAQLYFFMERLMEYEMKYGQS